jgi:threonine synthase
MAATRAVTAAPEWHSDMPVVTLACAHPAKFPDAVESAIGQRPALPAHLADLLEREERSLELPNDLGTVERAIAERARISMEVA